MPGFGECGVETRSALAVLDVVETVAALSTREPSELARLNGWRVNIGVDVAVVRRGC